MPSAADNAPTSVDPNRQFALDVVRRLRDAGYEALWAGGCVRDRLLGRPPKDYDVATNARPEQVRALFGKHRTLAIGAAFGVVAVLGARGVQPIEVATFRRDAQYSDGRHPDGVIFSNAAEDASRRDFTINGLFYDPLADRVVDYVGGQDDLQAGIVRAIGDPRKRFDEDKLRMLRAVRFTAVFDFTLDPLTAAAIRELAGEIVIVSAERIAAEMRAMLKHARRRRAVELLWSTGLLPIVLPESQALADPSVAAAADGARDADSPPARLFALVDALETPSFPAALALLLRGLTLAGVPVQPRQAAQRWRLTNQETAAVVRLLESESLIRSADSAPWPRVQRALAGGDAEELLAYVAAVARTAGDPPRALEFCRAKLALPRDEFNPPPLLGGDDLRRAGYSPGPRFRQTLDAVRDLQLDGLVADRAAALRHARELLDAPAPDAPTASAKTGAAPDVSAVAPEPAREPPPG